MGDGRREIGERIGEGRREKGEWKRKRNKENIRKIYYYFQNSVFEFTTALSSKVLAVVAHS
jgi:hypothetical protein